MKKIFIACDTQDPKIVKKIIGETKTKKLNIGYKFGLEFFNSRKGRSFISKLNKKTSVWVDLKLMDIPNTISSSIESLRDLKNLRYLTVHASGGEEMLKSAKFSAKKINKKLKVLAVTVLTSFSERSLKKIGYTKSIKQIVIKQAKLAKAVGLDGIVCSGHEVKFIKKICKKMEIVTPGIRMSSDKSNDQKRIMTPNLAFKNGATAIVLGRSITNGNIKKNIQRLIYSLD